MCGVMFFNCLSLIGVRGIISVVNWCVCVCVCGIICQLVCVCVCGIISVFNWCVCGISIFRKQGEILLQHGVKVHNMVWGHAQSQYMYTAVCP